MDDSSYSGYGGDKRIACPFFVLDCLDEQVTFISFPVSGGRRGSIMAKSEFYEF
jgi:hypothetical protein